MKTKTEHEPNEVTINLTEMKAKAFDALKQAILALKEPIAKLEEIERFEHMLRNGASPHPASRNGTAKQSRYWKPRTISKAHQQALREGRARKAQALLRQQPKLAPKTPITGPYTTVQQPEVILRVLSGNGGEMTTEAITAKMQAGGFPFKTDRPTNSVTVALAKLRQDGKVVSRASKGPVGPHHRMNKINLWKLRLPAIRVEKRG